MSQDKIVADTLRRALEAYSKAQTPDLPLEYQRAMETLGFVELNWFDKLTPMGQKLLHWFQNEDQW